MARPYMRAKLSIGLSVAILLSLGGCPSATKTSLPDLAGRQVKVAVMNDYPPFNYIDADTGEAVGWDYDVIGELGRRLNFTPVYETVPFSQTIDAVSAGTYDMAGDSISATYERAQKVDYSRSYLIVRQRLIVRAADDPYANLVDFKEDNNLRLGALAGSTNYTTATTYFVDHPVSTYSSISDAIDALLNGDIDGIIMDDLAYQAQYKMHSGEIIHVNGVLYADLLAFVFPKGSDLADAVTQALQCDGGGRDAPAVQREMGTQ